MTRVFIWKNNSPQEWEEISFSAFSKARRNGCFTGRFFVETVKMFRDEDDRITAVTESDESDAAKILELLKNPETAALLKQLAKAL